MKHEPISKAPTCRECGGQGYNKYDVGDPMLMLVQCHHCWGTGQEPEPELTLNFLLLFMLALVAVIAVAQIVIHVDSCNQSPTCQRN